MSRADVALLLICAVWGTTFALLRDALRTLHPFELMALRFTIASVILMAVYWRRLWPVRRRWLLDGLWLGVWLTAGYLTQMIGLQTVSASRSAFITSMTIAIVPFIAYFILRTRPVLGEALGVLLAAAGLAMLSADAGFALTPGELWNLGCAAAFAVHIVLTNSLAKRSPAIPLAVLQVSVPAAAGWALVAARGGLSVAPREIPWGVLIYLGVLATAFIIVLQTWALARTSSVKAGVLYATEPVFAAVFAASFFGERMTHRELAGAALILAGVIVSELWRPARAKWAERRRVRAARGLRGGSGPG
ncbi:MAG TPA: DMT family transporter [Candidatus Limnocylindrales bacterium]|nr:DMT family transporter [Candidatus Limnocylindrales bacterium]